MILSRIWYVILALLLAAAYYVVSLAVGQYNRRNGAAMEETLKSDSQSVSWALQLDARRRLDVLLLAAADPAVGKALRAANAKDPIPPTSKEEGAKALRAFNEKLPAEYKNDALFVTDRDGRVVAQVGYDSANAFPEFELGGYAAVFDALHGFLRDDTWVWGGRIARVVTRPVEDEVGQPPLGAVVGLRWVDNSFAKEIGKRTRTNIAFYALGQNIARAASTEGFEENSLEALGADLKAVYEDKQFKEGGRTDVRPLGDGEKGGVLFVRLPGEAWELNAGFAVARPKVSIPTAMGFIQGADDQDKKNVKLWIVAALVVGASAIGILFSFLESSLPMREMARQAARLKRGEIDVLSLPQFRGGYRPIASDINAGIQRVVEKGGGTARKPADLESILGPVPAQPSMSAFSFPMADASAVPQAVPQVPPGPPAPQGPPAPTGANRPAPPGVPNGPPPPLNRPNAPPIPGGTRPGIQDRTQAMPGVNLPGLPPPGPAAGAPPPVNAHSATVAAAGAPAYPAPPPTKPAAMAAVNAADKEEEEQTMVAQPSADLIAATGGGPAVTDPAAEWHAVYEEFLKTKRECGEPIDGLTFDKFKQTLTKNRDALIQRHGCKRVKFSVYVKEGRASLKATPVRD
ncbi:alpha 1 type XVII collagen [Labilithrix luteola]|uniref:Alpha 1 type XVII collagen n=2 Tax=Labilithrix luteola TaxID=1391654 RepID=A0A0K1QG18_9BACT|nr:alpha 1 type XVII collagen [Labilithrix luteola]